MTGEEVADNNPQDLVKYVFLDGDIVPWDQANIHISTHALLYGTGCFEGIRAYTNKERSQVYIFRGREHYERLLDSCKLLLINLEYSVDKLLEITKSVIKKNKFVCDLYLRPVAYKKFGPQFIGVNLHNVSDGYFMLLIPKDAPMSIQSIHAGTSSWRRNRDVSLPPRGKFTGSYINSNLAKAEALKQGNDDSILLTEEGYVSEATTSNLFVVRGGEIITPPLYADILEGITRETIIKLCDDMGLCVKERPIHRTELYIAEEVFICGTAAEIMSVTQIDHRPIAHGDIGPLTEKIGALFRKIVRGEVDQYRDFLDPVYE